MSGLYIHIPFCRQACHYCDFHFSTNLKTKADLVAALCREIQLRQDYLADQTISTLYLGGGTPTLLEPSEIEILFETVKKYFHLSAQAEVTIEANPDDLSAAKLGDLRNLGFNRLSLGVQSFHDPHLQYLNRSHDASQALETLEAARRAGFDNINLDLIYAIPAPGHEIWEADLRQALSFGVEHISAYCLTIEEKTVFGRWLQQQKIPAIDEEFASEQFFILEERLLEAGYRAYEIANFALPTYESQHNSNYWSKGNYLGIGPSAHSYDQNSRQYNISNNIKYIRALQQDQLPYEREVLSPIQQVNEYIMTSLRTIWGCDLAEIHSRFGVDLWKRQQGYLQIALERGWLRKEGSVLKLNRSGKLLADEITASLFLEEEITAEKIA